MKTKPRQRAEVPTHGAMAAVALDASRDLLAAGDKFRARRWLCDAIRHTRASNHLTTRQMLTQEIRSTRAAIAAKAVA